ncbi:hypothetical protein VNO77_41845 [Canavalia gladiata]|uniref:Protein kinase domain-containing protein n=1 Tax=Canavalia gladiata TaxID=3824 RepID=A0AAN9K0J2_CANGL
MATHSVFGFLCYFVLLLMAAAQKSEYYDECLVPSNCDYLGKISFPFTTSSKRECGIQIRGCGDPLMDKEIELEDENWYKIDRIIFPPDPDYILVFIHYHYPDLDRLTFPESPKTHFKISDNTSFFTYINKSNHVHEYAISFGSEQDAQNSPIHIHPNGQPPKFPCPSCTFLFSVLQISLQLPESCKPCYHEGCLCRFEFDGDGRMLNCTAITPPPAKTRNSKPVKIGLSVGLGTGIVVALFVILLLLYKRRNKYSGIQNQPRKTYSGSFRNTTYPESGAIYFGVPVFCYEELQEATNNFDKARELGEGGFGTVYYGKLRDGREVAVKRLFERNYRPVGSFINEIQILTRLRHKNLVSLYGCTSRHSRELLLVYEYVPNGTVACHLHGELAKTGFLPWHIRMKIAIETASALAYLHASDIIHRDVKSSNILLDDGFGVKVADFGLSRLFPDDATHVSTAPQGTPGYVDPDYRLCYQLTTKSDVYSFGVVLAELISSLPAVDVTRNRDDIKLANLAIRKIQKRAFCELVDPSLGFQSDEKLEKMITSVAELAFQCLQGAKELRPSMVEVLQVLQRIESGRDEPGNLEEIEVHGPRVPQSYALPPLPNSLMRPQRLHQTH